MIIFATMIVAQVCAFAEAEYAWAINFNLANADCSKITECHECSVSNCDWTSDPTTKSPGAGSCKAGLYADGKNGTMQVGTFFANAAKCVDT